MPELSPSVAVAVGSGFRRVRRTVVLGLGHSRRIVRQAGLGHSGAKRLGIGVFLPPPVVEIAMKLCLALAAIVAIVPVELAKVAVAPAAIMIVRARAVAPRCPTNPMTGYLSFHPGRAPASDGCGRAPRDRHLRKTTARDCVLASPDRVLANHARRIRGDRRDPDRSRHGYRNRAPNSRSPCRFSLC